MRATVDYDSKVVFVPPASLSAPCSRQDNGSIHCRLVMGSWVYNGFELDLRLGENAISWEMFEQHDRLQPRRRAHKWSLWKVA
uniref:Neur_chan_LBD domain-containing protein n=1 Tax=Macrostomum lignano TaxID=282301 RepID=A0A1I8IKX8_9PLAT